MTLYAVGDLQGCREPLEILLESVKFDPALDQLWLAGDLVNRGHDSLGSLRLVRSMGASARTVLGNHDLHLVALALADEPLKSNPDLDAVLEAPDGPELIEWLRHQPLLLRDEQRRVIMTHAGIPPIWSDEEAIDRAYELECVLADPDRCKTFINAMYGNEPERWRNDLTGIERWRYITNAFTRMRFCGQDGQLELKTKTEADKPPEGMKPWFEWPVQRNHTLLFGHWAALMGRTGDDDFVALDTGYVWNNYLTMLNVDSGLKLFCDTAGVVFSQ
ncbi:symmetrical bis(5'-nucleosyl)-tetraphosphatase [Saccharospirillum salsuginis]|uniref:bis(5'-nucleosyl)-tetraphosphatase (symmetrical) n=1 Tax=Saccharospirillum salsuginis TaxID=418750 RepID=A0A918K228_9GAMM|nr:symmetrical bis(5'-nucleosyl)-tetraphosphatase [Saccharospirillum salsuginis]GGX45380.1 bis(5'-nucleosyl)-tetraphosphatase, symmetrical [Saccharospirillum salsuginis]